MECRLRPSCLKSKALSAARHKTFSTCPQTVTTIRTPKVRILNEKSDVCAVRKRGTPAALYADCSAVLRTVWHFEPDLVGPSGFGWLVWQVTKLERDRRLRDRSASSDTHRYAVGQLPRHCEASEVKAMSGGDVKAYPRCSGEVLAGAENSRGDRIVGRANTSASGHGLLSGARP